MARKCDILMACKMEVAQNILLNLSGEKLFEIWNTVKRWRALMQGDYFWKKVCKKNYLGGVEKRFESSMYLKFLENFHYWQGIFMYNYTLRSNIINSIYYETKLKSENNSLSLHYLDNDVIVAEEFRSRNIVVFDSCTGEVTKTFFLKTGTRFHNVAVDKNNIAALTSNNYLEVWNIESEMELFAMQLPKRFKSFRTELHGKWIFLESSDSNLTVLNIERKKFYFEKFGVLRVCLYDNKVAFEAKKGYLTIVNLDTEEKLDLKCFEAIAIARIMVHNEALLCFNAFGKICVFSANNGTKQQMFTIKDMINLWSAIILDDHRILVSGRGDNFQIWDYLVGKFLVKVSMDRLGFWLITNNSYIFSCMSTPEDTSSISIWCSRTGKLLSTTNLKYAGINYSSVHVTPSKLIFQCSSNGKEGIYIWDYEKSTLN